MKRPLRHGSLAFGLLGLVLSFAASARADQTYLLSQLLGPNGVDVTIGDKTFYDFDFASSAVDKNGNDIAGVDPAKVFVSFTSTPDGVYYVNFKSASQFVAQNGGLGLGELFMGVLYFVHVDDPKMRVDALDLSRGGVSGGGTLDLQEGVLYSGPPGGATFLEVSSPGNLFDATDIAPSSDLLVLNLVQLNGSKSRTGNTKFTDFSNSFHQVAVPEPASCVLLGVGLLLGGAVWRRRPS